MIPKIGDTIETERETFVVSSFMENTKGQTIVIWSSSKKNSGGCIPSVWNEWKNGYDRSKRRGQYFFNYENYKKWVASRRKKA